MEILENLEIVMITVEGDSSSEEILGIVNWSVLNGTTRPDLV